MSSIQCTEYFQKRQKIQEKSKESEKNQELCIHALMCYVLVH